MVHLESTYRLPLDQYMIANNLDVLICSVFLKQRHVRVIHQSQMFHLEYSQQGTMEEKIKYWNIVNEDYFEVAWITESQLLEVVCFNIHRYEKWKPLGFAGLVFTPFCQST